MISDSSISQRQRARLQVHQGGLVAPKPALDRTGPTRKTPGSIPEQWRQKALDELGQYFPTPEPPRKYRPPPSKDAAIAIAREAMRLLATTRQTHSAIGERSEMHAVRLSNGAIAAEVPGLPHRIVVWIETPAKSQVWDYALFTLATRSIAMIQGGNS